MQYQREGDRHLLIPSTAFAGGSTVLSLDHYSIAQHALFSGCSYRYNGETIDGHELIKRVSKEPKVQLKQNLELYLPQMHQRRSVGRSID